LGGSLRLRTGTLGHALQSASGHNVGPGPQRSTRGTEDLAGFAEGISDDHAGRRLGRAIQGKGAFRRFKDELHEEYPDLLPMWYAATGG
jgi:hypothetical protein